MALSPDDVNVGPVDGDKARIVGAVTCDQVSGALDGATMQRDPVDACLAAIHHECAGVVAWGGGSKGHRHFQGATSGNYSIGRPHTKWPIGSKHWREWSQAGIGEDDSLDVLALGADGFEIQVKWQYFGAIITVCAIVERRSGQEFGNLATGDRAIIAGPNALIGSIAIV